MAKLAKSKVEFLSNLPSSSQLKLRLGGKNQSCTILVYDRVLNRTSGFGRFADLFDASFAVRSGESLKSLKGLERFLAPRFWQAVSGHSRKEIVLVAAGGGSVGDFAGFLASVLKRGVRLVHMPTTWLAATDSAHGGKTALNVGRMKNQIGSFYPAERVLIIRSLLDCQPKKLEVSAWGEMIKMAYISGGVFWRKVISCKEFGPQELWRFLPEAIRAKQRIVRRDPFETKGERILLNLGHTLGHALELGKGLPHGLAVANGMAFAMSWSRQRGHISGAQMAEFESLWNQVFSDHTESGRRFLKMKPSEMRTLLAQDKKTTQMISLQFVFPRGPGRVVAERVSLAEVLAEARRQNWLR